ncbi:hypothetical protein SCHPADRAFT_289659 [Schizopora paradoxa]|uniref:F-box domain-containing protein n=1 Tax=Schizopora paradoxa TaxID=27342 RepID=A0A0H2RS88_9AGAM|nr:hypothetical protein SCHPADRAFT_289659 [Schizopora paradoxa]
MPSRSRKRAAKRVKGEESGDVSSCLSHTASEPVDSGSDEHHSPPTLAQNLPVEILSEIFAYAIPTTVPPLIKAATLPQWRAYFSLIFPLNLAVVCRTWRLTTLQTPALWTSIFIEVHSAPSRALKALGRCLSTLLDRSSGSRLGLRVGIYFSGTFQFAMACNAVQPLLECQRRWECVEIKFEESEKPKGGLVLNVGKLAMLKSLELHGGFWETHSHVGQPTTDESAAFLDLQLPLLRALNLRNLRQNARMPLVMAAHNLEELIISVNMVEQARRPPICLEHLKKLTIVSTCWSSDVLGSFRCPSLEELVLDGMTDRSFEELHRFVQSSAMFLRVLRVSVMRYFSPGLDLLTHLFQVLTMQTKLAVLAIAAEKAEKEGRLDEALLMHLLSRSDPCTFRCCPNLEDLHICGVLGHEATFSRLVRRRWHVSPRSIRKMRFHNCWTFHKQGPPHERLIRIEDESDYKEEGLDIEATYAY